jgi:hypothetical protein
MVLIGFAAVLSAAGSRLGNLLGPELRNLELSSAL